MAPDEEGFRQVFERCYRPVYHLFKKYGFSSEESKELTQETFLRVYRSFETFRGETSLETWFFQVARNIALNERRSRHTQKRSGIEVSFEDAAEKPSILEAPVAEDPLRDLIEEERVRILRQALEDLPPSMRQCVMLRVERDLKYTEIAAIMQLSVDSVKALLYRARKRLQERVGGHFADL